MPLTLPQPVQWPSPFPPPKLPKPNPQPLPKWPDLKLPSLPWPITLPKLPLVTVPPITSLPGSFTVPTPQPQPVKTFGDTHRAFMVFLAEIVGVIVLSFVADTDPDVGKVVMALMVVVALIWLMYHGDLLLQWTRGAGLGQ